MAALAINAELDTLCVNSVRVLAADTVEKAKSGHPGAPMGCAPIAHVLFGEAMNFSPSNSLWDNRDRFVLSNGHACALLYTMLHLTGYPLSMNDLKQFRQLGSLTPGHPENFVTRGVEVSTGPLGQGLSNAVGMAMAERHLAATFNRPGFDVVDHFTFVICGDGCLQEGVTSEASSLAGHLGLGKLIVCYDDNKITIDGNTDLSFTEDVGKRYEAYGWQVLTVTDANNLSDVRAAIAAAKADLNRPTLIKIQTIIGHGSAKQGTHGVHGAPLGADDLKFVKTKFGFDPNASFTVDPRVSEFYSERGRLGAAKEGSWNEMMAAYEQTHPSLSSDYRRRYSGVLPAGWKDKLPKYVVGDKTLATRQTSQQVLNACATVLSELFGGSADLTPSNLTALTCSGDFQKGTPAGRYIRFGVREHGMAAICNGIFAHGGTRPFCATFLQFIGYAMGSVRLSALSRFGVLYIMTHDSIGLGEDGPTHQPVEMLESLRATPNLYTMRPCDGNETVGAYVVALEAAGTPTVISLSRQGCPTLQGSSAEKTAQGAYVLQDHKGSSADGLLVPSLILASTGSEVCVTAQTAAALVAANSGLWVRVVSMPCWELFDNQSVEYQMSVFPDGSPVMSVEASAAHGWQKYAHAPFGMQSYGLSAPGETAMEHFGFTVANLSARGAEVIAFYSGKQVISRVNSPRFAAPKDPHGH
jgi:transketolase